jgi:hypothetical protein
MTFDFTDRVLIADWLNARGLNGAAAEIGCAFGGYARSILSRWRGVKYYMVDPFCNQPTEVYRERQDGINYEQYYRDCKLVEESDPRVQIIRKYSVEGAKDIPDASLDWVFIDGNHSYRAVLEDMDAWFPKVKIGGVFSGHDYGDDTNYPNWCEVKSAVDRWMKEHCQEFEFTADSWWCLKTYDHFCH